MEYNNVYKSANSRRTQITPLSTTHTINMATKPPPVCVCYIARNKYWNDEEYKRNTMLRAYFSTHVRRHAATTITTTPLDVYNINSNDFKLYIPVPVRIRSSESYCTIQQAAHAWCFMHYIWVCIWTSSLYSPDTKLAIYTVLFTQHIYTYISDTFIYIYSANCTMYTVYI